MLWLFLQIDFYLKSDFQEDYGGHSSYFRHINIRGKRNETVDCKNDAKIFIVHWDISIHMLY